MNSLHADLARATIDIRRAEATERHLATRARPARRRPLIRRRPILSRLVRVFRLPRRATVVDRTPVVPTPLPRRPSTARRTPPTADVVLDGLLGLVAARIVEHGTPSEARVLTTMSAAVRREHPGAAAALVDWNGAEVARLRAFGVAAGRRPRRPRSPAPSRRCSTRSWAPTSPSPGEPRCAADARAACADAGPIDAARRGNS